jgi:hypothetical protein
LAKFEDPMQFDFDPTEEEIDFGPWEGFCQACEEQERVNDIGLCESCAGKLERDLIRRGDWEYTVLASGVDQTAREALRREVIRTYGKQYELIMAPKRTPKAKP